MCVSVVVFCVEYAVRRALHHRRLGGTKWQPPSASNGDVIVVRRSSATVVGHPQHRQHHQQQQQSSAAVAASANASIASINGSNGYELERPSSHLHNFQLHQFSSSSRISSSPLAHHHRQRCSHPAATKRPASTQSPCRRHIDQFRRLDFAGHVNDNA